MISEKNTLIGHLVETNGTDFVAQLISDDEGFIPEVTVDGVDVRIGQIGSYLMVRQSGVYVLVIVESMWQEVELEGELHTHGARQSAGRNHRQGWLQPRCGPFPDTGAELHLVGAATLSSAVFQVQRSGFQSGQTQLIRHRRRVHRPGRIFSAVMQRSWASRVRVNPGR